jgi:glycosyltransferase involved in cell wall biosynthesis
MKVCFWGNISKSLEGRTDGGGELQIALLAKILVLAGHDVVIVDPSIQKDFVTAEGINIVGIDDWDKGLRVIRTLTHQYLGLYKALKAQKADVYYCRIRDFRHIIAYWASRSVNGKFILGLASDLDAMNFVMRCRFYYFKNLKVGVSRLWWFFDGLMTELVYPFLLRKADNIFVQHEGQKHMLQDKNINSILFPNLIQTDNFPIVGYPSKEDFIYVGSLDERKGFNIMFDIINKAPNCTFKIVGSPRDSKGGLLFKKLESIKNTTLLGRLTHSDTLIEIATSKALGIPVISLFINPDNIIQAENLGYFTNGNLTELINVITEFNNGGQNKFVKTKHFVENKYSINPYRIKNTDELFKKL